MKKKEISIAAFIYMNLLPYLARLPRGLEWAMQYLPDKEHLLGGLIFIHSFYSIPAALLVVSIYVSKKYAIPFVLTFLALTITTVYINHGYDLSSDAQAAIGLVFMPIFVSFIGAIAFALGLVTQYMIIRKTKKSIQV